MEHLFLAQCSGRSRASLNLKETNRERHISLAALAQLIKIISKTYNFSSHTLRQLLNLGILLKSPWKQDGPALDKTNKMSLNWRPLRWLKHMVIYTNPVLTKKHTPPKFGPKMSQTHVNHCKSLINQPHSRFPFPNALRKALQLWQAGIAGLAKAGHHLKIQRFGGWYHHV